MLNGVITMNTNSKSIEVVIGVILFVIGVILLMSSTSLGLVIAHNTIISNGGAMDTQMYYWILQSNALNFRILGTILAVVGVFLVIYTRYTTK